MKCVNPFITLLPSPNSYPYTPSYVDYLLNYPTTGIHGLWLEPEQPSCTEAVCFTAH